MTKGEKWRKLFESKGWLNENVIRGQDNDSLDITIRGCCGSPERNTVTIDSALIMPELDMLCYEDGKGTVYFNWEDIVQVRQMPASKKKGWL
ncbi:MAG: hypothetical protein KOO62_09095 [candidate division Zixibacteria bacterium]|nr:hypothetical protein [candidate division Zixibacteria bacterium]